MKKLLAVLVLFAMVVSASFSVFADELNSDALVEKGDDYYYLEDGQPVNNRWIQDGDNWYYFSTFGKMYKDGIKKIGETYYAFDSDGMMLKGFLDENLDSLDGTEDDNLFQCTYLFDENDGAMYTGWYQGDIVNLPAEYYGKDEVWFYFNPSNGKKLVSTSKKIDGNTFAFDENGVMRSGWYEDPDSGVMSYYGEDNSGVKMMNGWLQTIGARDDEDADKSWFYFKNGKLQTGKVIRIDGKYYKFSDNGKLSTGLFAGDCKSVSGINVASLSSIPDTTTYEEMIDPDRFDGQSIFKFTTDGMVEDAESSSSFDGDSYKLKFKKGGAALHGLNGSKLYINGILVKADSDSEEKYSAARLTDEKRYFVNKDGTVMKKGKYAKGGDYYYAVSKAGALGVFEEKDDAKEFAKSQETEDVNVSYIN